MIDRLLQLTSRTFALSIPLLPERVRDDVTIAYLFFRVADTLEDEPSWSSADRAAALRRFSDVLKGDSTPVAEILPGSVSDGGCAELLQSDSDLFEALEERSPEAKQIIVDHLGRTIDGMCHFLQADGGVATLDEVREYCYYVAGIVGELCTALFVLESPSLEDRAEALVGLAPAFGEALQLVNILRDEDDDAADGRRFIPSGQDRAELMAIAIDDLERASRYVMLLEEGGADRGIVAFNTLNLLLAYGTLRRVRDEGPGAKLSREDVRRTLESITSATDEGASVGGLLRTASSHMLEGMPASEPLAEPKVWVAMRSASSH